MSPRHELKTAVEEMNKLRAQIAEYLEKFPRIQNNIYPYLRKYRENGEFLTYIVFGTGLIENVLDKLFLVVMNHSTSHTKAFQELGSAGAPLEVDVLDVVPKSGDSFGRLIGLLEKNFQISLKYPELNEKLTTLNRKRNDIVHDLIDQYEGDIQKANDDLKSFTKNQPIEILLKEIFKIQNEIVDQQENDLQRFYEMNPKPDKE